MDMNPIGVFYGDAVYKYDAPRQGRLFAGHLGKIVLHSSQNYETALRDLDGFERIWVIFLFHENKGWRPTTRPPVPPMGRERVGTFASRSPYRPNPIGLSCVRLLKIEGLTLYVDESDMLSGTPILDIKPYIPMADSFPEAKAGWVEEQDHNVWQIAMSNRFKLENTWIINHSVFDLYSFACVQLAHGPFDKTRHRLVVDNDKKTGILAYRTFRIHFDYNERYHQITLNLIKTGYSFDELANSEDRYGDKELHRKFVQLQADSGFE